MPLRSDGGWDLDDSEVEKPRYGVKAAAGVIAEIAGDPFWKYDPEQPRDEQGRWTDGGVATAPNDADRESDVLSRADADPDVRKARALLHSEIPTAARYQKPDESYVEHRQVLHEKIVEGMLNPEAVAPVGTNPKMVMLLGLPASGKSKVLRAGIEGKFTAIDADSIKAQLPEYTGANAGTVHKESGHVAETMLLPRAMDARHNILLDWTGKNTEKTMHFVRSMKDAGYDVEVHHVTVPPAEAASRALERFKTDGRFVDPEYIIKGVGRKPDETYKALRDSGMVSRWRSFTNDVPRGTKPVLLEEGRR